MDLISVVFWGLGRFFLLVVVGPSVFGCGLVPMRNFRVFHSCFDGGVFKY